VSVYRTAMRVETPAGGSVCDCDWFGGSVNEDHEDHDLLPQISNV
jgi:hypothetical protein